MEVLSAEGTGTDSALGTQCLRHPGNVYPPHGVYRGECSGELFVVLVRDLDPDEPGDVQVFICEQHKSTAGQD
jgi:hypothetical protein